MTDWIVFFDCGDGTGESVIRKGETAAEVMSYADNLGCLPVRAVPAAEVEITALWSKNGVLRCSVKEPE